MTRFEQSFCKVHLISSINVFVVRTNYCIAREGKGREGIICFCLPSSAIAIAASAFLSAIHGLAWLPLPPLGTSFNASMVYVIFLFLSH
ncbi:hypothetical protein VNO80_05229 [Phaseolus coccineus]|uniref:Uncharacterized protein n=1 Tax=Phaseolus coccineus TaxID=3886 RepID=A0AAN9NJL3_PHACN